jgi:hypothetical protein
MLGSIAKINRCGRFRHPGSSIESQESNREKGACFSNAGLACAVNSSDISDPAPPIFVSVRNNSVLCFVQLTENLNEPLFRLEISKGFVDIVLIKRARWNTGTARSGCAEANSWRFRRGYARRRSPNKACREAGSPRPRCGFGFWPQFGAAHRPRPGRSRKPNAGPALRLGGPVPTCKPSATCFGSARLMPL